MTTDKAKEKAMEYFYDSCEGTYDKLEKAINIAIDTTRKLCEKEKDIELKERDKQWEDAIDKCTADGSIKIIKKHLRDKK